jgi:hypothetical protein
MSAAMTLATGVVITTLVAIFIDILIAVVVIVDVVVVVGARNKTIAVIAKVTISNRILVV